MWPICCAEDLSEAAAVRQLALGGGVMTPLATFALQAVALRTEAVRSAVRTGPRGLSLQVVPVRYSLWRNTYRSRSTISLADATIFWASICTLK
jgi:hypothetical protein